MKDISYLKAYDILQKSMEEEINNYKEINKISDLQKKALEEGNIEVLNGLINDKQRYIDKIKDLVEKLKPYNNILAENHNRISRDVFEKLQKTYDLLQNTLKEARIKDQESLQAMTHLRNSFKEGLSTLRNSSRVVSNTYFSYDKVNIPVPQYIDKKR